MTSAGLKRWRSDLWRANLVAIEAAWETTLTAWVERERLPAFDRVVAERPSFWNHVTRARLGALGR